MSGFNYTLDASNNATVLYYKGGASFVFPEKVIAPSRVKIYQLPNFDGKSLELDGGSWHNYDLSNVGFSTVGSIVIPPNTTVDVFSGDFSGTSARISSTTKDCTSIVAPITSLTIIGPAPTPRVRIYQLENYQGFDGPSSYLDLEVGTDYSDGWLADLAYNDYVGSMIIPAGITVTAWQNNFWGNSATFTGNVPKTADTLTSISSLRISGTAPVYPTYTITAIGDNMIWKPIGGINGGFYTFRFDANSKLRSIGKNGFNLYMGFMSTYFGVGILFPPTLTTIGEKAFYYTGTSINPSFPQLKNPLLADVILPSSVTSIGSLAFEKWGPDLYVKIKPILTWSSALITPRQIGNTFTYTATSGGPNGAPGYNLTTSSMPIVYASTNTSIATINSSTGLVTIIASGSVTFTASQGSESTSQLGYTAADTITSTTLVVSPDTSAPITFNDINKIVGNPSFTVTATSANTQGAYTYTSSNSSVATIVGNTVTIVGIVGTSTITATQAASPGYSAGSKTAILTVGKGVTTLTDYTFSKNYLDAPFQITAPAGTTGGTMNYILLSGDSAVATITTGGWITILKAGGPLVFSATQGSTTNYEATTAPALITFTVNKLTPVLSNFLNISKAYGNPDFTITPPSGYTTSGGTMSYSLTGGDTTVASITGDLIKILKIGTVTITANQAATTNYNSPVSVSATLTVVKGATTLTGYAFSKIHLDAPFQITAPSGTTGGTLNYVISGVDSGIATITPTGNVVTILKAGSVVFAVTQGSTTNYEATTAPAFITLTVNKLTPTITVSDISKNTMDIPFTFLYTSKSGENASDGTMSYTSSASNVATINSSSGLVTIVGVGSTTIKFSQLASTNYNAPSDATAVLTVTIGTPTLTNFTIASKIYAPAFSFQVNPPTIVPNNTGALHYSSDSPLVATITDNGYLTIVGGGTARISVIQSATDNFLESSVSTTFSVTRATPTITVSSTFNINIIDPPLTLVYSTASNGIKSFSSSKQDVATINSSGVITTVGAGSTTITISISESLNYIACSATTVVVVASAVLTDVTIPQNSNLTGKDLSGVSLVDATIINVNLSNSNLSGANFSNADISGTDFTNTKIVGASNLPTFSIAQKIQLLYNTDNATANIPQLQFSTPLSVLELNSALATPIPALSQVNTEFIIAAPVYVNNVKTVTISPSSISSEKNTSFYIPLLVGESVKINNMTYALNASNKIVDSTGNVLKVIVINGNLFKVYSGSIVAVNISDFLNNITFDVDKTIGLRDVINAMTNSAIASIP